MAALSTSFLSASLPVAEPKPLVAELTCGGGAVPAMTLDVGVKRVGCRSMDLVSLDGGSLERLSQVRFAWIDVDLGEHSIRPLVEIVSTSAGSASVRYRHLFPKQQAQLDAFTSR